ncbi:hypothetical protein [Polaromonas sp.]|uniref:hypothetical protein n=1 Tax=Polaromonas sp. TaxID=1869339 RepID=UPI00352A4737
MSLLPRARWHQRCADHMGVHLAPGRPAMQGVHLCAVEFDNERSARDQPSLALIPKALGGVACPGDAPGLNAVWPEAVIQQEL